MGWTRRDFAATFQRMIRDRYIEVGKEVRRLRLSQGYTQEALAHKAGVTTKTISRMESPPKEGEPHETRPGTYRKVAEALGVSVAHLRAPLTRNAEITETPSEILERELGAGVQDHGRAEEEAARLKAEQDRRARGAGSGDA